MADIPAGRTDYKSVGTAIDEAGWQQFSFVKREDHSVVLACGQHSSESEYRLLVISHSCDLIHHSEQEPFVELLLLEELAADFKEEPTHQSPRMRVVTAYRGDRPPIRFLARAAKRISVPRECLTAIRPDMTLSLRNAQDVGGIRGTSERHLGDWMAGRYNRGWTSSEFDRRLKVNIGPIQKSLKRLRASGVDDIFMRVTPSDELRTEEPYEVSLVVLVDPASAANLHAIQAESRTLAQAVNNPGKINVVTPPTVDLSTNVGYGYIRGWLRFYDVLRDSLASTSAPP